MKKKKEREEIKGGSQIMRQDDEKEKALERKMNRGGVRVRSRDREGDKQQMRTRDIKSMAGSSEGRGRGAAWSSQGEWLVFHGDHHQNCGKSSAWHSCSLSPGGEEARL